MIPQITVLTLGPGDPELLTLKAVRCLESSSMVVLRTDHHPVADFLRGKGISFSYLDDLYLQSEDFDDLARKISDFLWREASSSPLVYAVPDPFSDASVRALFRHRPAGAQITLVPGAGYTNVSMLDAYELLPGSDLRFASATDLISSGSYDPNVSLLVSELDGEILAGDLKIFLSSFLSDDDPVFLLHPGAAPLPLQLYEIDRQSHYDHLTSLLVPGAPYDARSRFVFSDLMSIMDRLRSPNGCPWDRRQTHKSLCPYVVEEAWETVGAIDEDDPAHLMEELGDLLFQVAFHSSIACSFDEFTVNDVVSGICSKMIRRHPHVFSGAPVPADAQQENQWEKIKSSETGSNTVAQSLSDISVSLPSLLYAEKYFRKMSRLPDCSRAGTEILEEIRLAAADLGRENDDAVSRNQLGILLALCAEWAQLNHMDAETLLHEVIRDRIQVAQSCNLLKSAPQNSGNA